MSYLTSVKNSSVAINHITETDELRPLLKLSDSMEGLSFATTHFHEIDESFPLLKLDDSLVLSILEELNEIGLAHVSLACRRLHTLENFNPLWQRLFQSIEILFTEH